MKPRRTGKKKPWPTFGELQIWIWFLPFVSFLDACVVFNRFFLILYVVTVIIIIFCRRRIQPTRWRDVARWPPLQLAQVSLGSNSLSARSSWQCAFSSTTILHRWMIIENGDVMNSTPGHLFFCPAQPIWNLSIERLRLLFHFTPFQFG